MIDVAGRVGDFGSTASLGDRGGCGSSAKDRVVDVRDPDRKRAEAGSPIGRRPEGDLPS